MSARVFGALSVLVMLAPGSARADSGPAPSAQNAACDHESSALGRGACLLGSALSGQANGALVVAAPAAGDARVAAPARIAERLAQLVAAKLGTAARPNALPLALAEAQRTAGDARGLVYLSTTLFRDHVQVSADLYTGAGHFWQRLRSPGLHLKQHAFATSPLDPELRALFPTIPIVLTRVDKAALPEHDVLALACGDLRGDGSTEIATVGRRRVSIGALEQARFVVRASLNWADFSAIAPSPLRQPIATGGIPEPGHLHVGLSDRDDTLDLSSTLQVLHEWHGVMAWPGAGCTHRAGLGYDGRAQACPGSAPTANVDFGTPLDAFASRLLADHNGQARTLSVARAVGATAARALDPLHPEVNVPNVGAQLAVGDLDQDGLPEIVSSSPSLDRKADQLVVRTLGDNGQLRERLRLAVPSGIDAIAICPSDGRAMAPLALATGDGIWVVR